MSNKNVSDISEDHAMSRFPLPAWQVFSLLAGMVALWTVLCAVSHSAPDLDGMEELVWASSFELGYYKHPPFPSWLLYALSGVFGKPVWLTFFAGQMLSALALWFVWRLGCEFTTPRKALLAMLMVSTTVYFSLRGTIYNHNTAQLWSIAASTWLLYRALRYQKISSWIWLGVVAGLAFITKYSAVVQFAVFFLFMLAQGHFREAASRKGVAVALLMFMLVAAPHFYWLAANDFAPLTYAEDSFESGGYVQVLKSILNFSLDQLVRLSPMLVVWLALFYWNKRTGNRGASSYARDLSAWDRSFLLWIGLGPFIATVLVSAVLGRQLVASWATTFFILYGFFALWWLSGGVRLNLRRTIILVVALHVLMALAYALARGPVAYNLGRKTRSTFPGPDIAAQMQKVWSEHVPGIPLQLVASDTWLGGNIAVNASPQAHVFIDASYVESPWLNPGTALECGVLVAYSETLRANPMPALKQLYDTAAWKGVVALPWSTIKSPAIVVNWGIIPPQPTCRANRPAK